MKLAYLVNTYPLPSHSFIRREIHALERMGYEIHRMAMRSDQGALVDPADIAENTRTEHLLREGLVKLAKRALPFAFHHLKPALKALKLALACGGNGAGNVAGTGGRLRHLVYWLEAVEVARRCHDLRLPHIHAHFGTNSATVAMLAAQIGGLSYSFTTHGPEEFDAPRAHVLGEKVARSAFSVAISSFGRAQLCRWTEYKDWPRLNIVHCGIEPWRFPEPAALSEGPLQLVAIGRLSEQKGFPILIEAMAQAVKSAPELRLRLLGEGPFRPLLEAQIKAHGLEAQIELAGWQDEASVRAALGAAHALVLPSFAEGLPMVVMEAFAAGRPVIASAIAGLPELVTPDCGWLVPAGDPAALAKAMLKAHDTPRETLREMGKVGRARVLARHDIDKEAAKLAKLFADHANL